MISASRRALLASAVAIHAPAAKDPDAELSRLLEAWRTNIRQHQQLDALAEGDEVAWLTAYPAVFAENRELDAAIAAIPARSLAGLRAKIEVATYSGGCDDGDVLRSLLNDICIGGPFS